MTVARPTLMSHRKFYRLMARLKLPKWGALGLLEALWQPSYECGDALVGDTLDLAARVDWREDQEVLAAALVECGFLDKDGETYTIHDFWHNAPDYVRRRFRRESRRKDKSRPTGEDDEPDYGQESPTDQPVTGHRPASDRSGGSEAECNSFTTQSLTSRSVNDRSRVATPAPAPAPAPLKEANNIASLVSKVIDDARKSGEANPKAVGSRGGGNGGFRSIGAVGAQVMQAQVDGEAV